MRKKRSSIWWLRIESGLGESEKNKKEAVSREGYCCLR